MRVRLSPRSVRWLLLPVVSVLLVPIMARGANPAERLDLGGGVALEIVRVEPGTFQQGSPAAEPGRRADETLRTVTLTQPFWLGKYPVTRGEFARFAEETNYRTEAEKGTSGGYGWDGAKLTQRKEFFWKNPGFPQTDSDPAVLVTYADAQAFLKWLSRKTSRAFSLPSEAQWEYACRAGSTTAFATGNDPARLDGAAWFLSNADHRTHLVGHRPLNAWGLGEMPGNVWQWCEDWYAPYSGSAVTDPLQTQSNLSDKPRRVLRGGSWLRPAADLRSAARYRNDAASRNADNGFRVMTFAAASAALPANPLPKPVAEQPRSITPAESAAPSAPDRITPVSPPRAGPPSFSDESYPPTRASRGFPFRGLLFGGVVLFIFFAVVVGIIRAIAKSGATGVMPGNLGSSGGGPLRTRIVDDGFWIESASLPAGTVLECRYSAGGKQNQTNVTFQGGTGGQFVFTGSRPSSVAVAVLPGGGPSGGGRIGGSPLGRAAGMMTGLDDPSSQPDDDADDRRRRRHPPAY